MASISFSGIGSGIDIQGIVDSLVGAERDPAKARLDAKEAEAQAKISSYGNLKSTLSSLQSSIISLSTSAAFSKSSATVANPDLFSVATNTLAQAGTYSVKVNTLAQAHTLASDATTPFSNLSDAVGTGTLKFEFGTYSGGTFTANPDNPGGSVVISAADNSLQGIRDAVNNANIGVTATIVNDGSGYRLLFSSDNSGVDNSLKITVSGDSSGSDTDTSGLSQFAYDPEASVGNGKNLTQTVAATNASVDINGLNVTSSTNSVSGAIAGVTLNLKDISASATTLTIANDTQSITGSINSFVQNFNAFSTLVSAATDFNATTQQGGILIGDSVTRRVETGIRNLLSSTFGSGTLRSLAEIGITTKDDGTLTVDNAKFSDALANNYQDVANIFAATGTPSDSLTNFISYGADTKQGDYTVSVDTLATQGTFQGVSGISSVTLNAANKSLALTVNGVTTDTITLTEGTYDTNDKLATLASEIQTKFNDDQALKDQGISVIVNYDTTNGRFVINSSLYGSQSTVDVSTENADLGLTSSGTAITGVDVAGSIAGLAATGSGQLLTGTGNAKDLVLEITGGNTGSRGSVNFTRGLADRLNTLIGNFLDDTGIIETRLDGLNNDIEDVNQQRDALNVRLASLTERLTKQYTALDTLVAQLNTTSQFLTQQLGALSQFGSSPNSNSSRN